MQNGNKLIAGLLVAAAVFFIVWNNFSKPNPSKIIAQVNEEVITYGNLQDEKEQYANSPDLPNNDFLIQRLINQKVAKIYAKKNGYFSDSEIIEEFEWQKNESKKSLLITYLLEQEGKKNVILADADYLDYIELHPYIQVMTIFIPVAGSDTTKAYKTISKAYKKLLSGSDFKKIRDKYMEKRFLNDVEGKEIIKQELLVNLYNDTLEVEEFTKPINTPNGYYLIKRFTDPNFEIVKEQIHDQLLNEKQQSYIARYIDSLKRSISIDENNLKLFLESEAQSDNNIVIVHFDGYDHVVKLGEIKQYFDYFLTPEQIQNIGLPDVKNIVNEIALQEILYDIAVDQDLESSDGFQLIWKNEESDLTKKWDNFVVNKVYMNIFSEGIEISNEEIQEYYDNNKKEFTENKEIQPFNTVKYKIKYELQNQKMNEWFDNIIEEYNIVVEKK
ncbi:MAG: hypothetical protein U9P79_02785 [Candidatus Cloacimonadota bacterium]|nr:hypothetical protein [Candidatus Cloacimonadota bacterium]